MEVQGDTGEQTWGQGGTWLGAGGSCVPTLQGLGSCELVDVGLEALRASCAPLLCADPQKYTALQKRGSGQALGGDKDKPTSC